MGYGIAIVALTAKDDPITNASAEALPHATLLFLGTMADNEAVNSAGLVLKAVQAVANRYQTFTDKVAGTAVLGAAVKADVVLMDGAHLIELRNLLLENPKLKYLHDRIEQFPGFIPHVTMGMPNHPRLSSIYNQEVKFDRLGVWFGDNRYEFPLVKPVTLEDLLDSVGVVEEQLAPEYRFTYYLHDMSERSEAAENLVSQGVPEEIAEHIANARPFYELEFDCTYTTATGEVMIELTDK